MVLSASFAVPSCSTPRNAMPQPDSAANRNDQMAMFTSRPAPADQHSAADIAQRRMQQK
jgi:hypothetical protein